MFKEKPLVRFKISNNESNSKEKNEWILILMASRANWKNNSYRLWVPKLLKRQSSEGCRFNPHYRRVTIQEYLTFPVMANGIRTGDPVDSIKDVVLSSVKVPEFDKHLKKAGWHIGRNVVEIAMKMKAIVRKPIMKKMPALMKFWYRLWDINFCTFNNI